MIQIDQLTKTYGKARGVTDLSLSVPEGSFFGFIGPNGAGKSTTIRTLLDSETSIGATVFRSGVNAIAQGDFALMGEGRLKLGYLGADPDVVTGDLIVTTGLGDYFPSQLVIGYVEEVGASEDGLSQYAVIRPQAELEGLTQVFIITDFTIVD